MPLADDAAALRNELAARQGVPPNTVRVVRSPYRICPLGAHIDHQLGRVTAMALDRGVLLAYAPLPAPEVRLTSRDFPGEVAFRYDDVPDRIPGDWGNFPRGAVCALQRSHSLTRGLVGRTQGSIAEGGLSSSAAVGVAYLLALEDVNGLPVTPADNIRLDQYIENEYLGLRNGILDQSAILLSRRGHLTVVDCATVQHELVPRPAALPPFAVLIAGSGLRQTLVSTDYNRRVAECAEAARVLLAAAGRPSAEPLLGNVSAAEYAAHRDRLSGPAARRAQHFFSEMDRVDRGVDAWRRGDLAELGRLITASGESSIRHYECGAPPLVDLYHVLIETPGVLGARFSGAGFRGCCLALAAPQLAERAAARVQEAYAQRYPELASRAEVLISEPDDGAQVLSQRGSE
jgi:galacturonokinase